MKFIVLAIFMVVAAPTAQAVDPSIYREPDAQSRFRDAQLHVKKLMDAGQYQEAAKYMPVYQTLACEVAEQRAGRSAEESTASCMKKNGRGDVAGVSAASRIQQQLDQSSDASADILGPGIRVMPRTMPGSSTALDGSTPSLLMFDPRNSPGTSSSSSRPEPPVDPWTGKR